MFPWRWRVLHGIVLLPLALILGTILIIKAALFRIFVSPFRWMAGRYLSGKPGGRPVRLLCLAYMNDENASARHRLYNYRNFIDREDIEFHIHPPSSVSVYRRFFLPWTPGGHLVYFIVVFLSRFASLWRATGYDAVFLQREILSEFFYDPPFFIFILRLLNGKIIYDVDDALWMLPPHSVRSRSRVLNTLALWRFHWNVRLSRRVIVSNDYIAHRAGKVNGAVHVVPTLVDVSLFPVRQRKERDAVVIGWTGGGGNLACLRLVEKPLARLAEKHPLRLAVLSSRPIALKGVPMEFIPWDKESEPRHIADFDIGIMPLPENEYTRGKGGFKLLEYMAAGLPAVVSPVGVNRRILRDGETGFFAASESDWENRLGELIETPARRGEMGSRAREWVAGTHDYRVWTGVFVEIIRKAVKEK